MYFRPVGEKMNYGITVYDVPHNEFSILPGPKGQKISKANCDVFDSSKKQTKLTEDTILRVFRSFFAIIRDFMIRFRDFLTFGMKYRYALFESLFVHKKQPNELMG